MYQLGLPCEPLESDSHNTYTLHGHTLYEHTLHGHTLHGHTLYGHALYGHARSVRDDVRIRFSGDIEGAQ